MSVHVTCFSRLFHVIAGIERVGWDIFRTYIRKRDWALPRSILCTLSGNITTRVK